MKSRIAAAILFLVLVVFYYSLYIAIKSPGYAFGMIYRDLFVVCIALLIPSVISGLFLGKFLLHGKRHWSYKLWMGFVVSFVVYWIYYYIAYCIYVIRYPDILAKTPTEIVKPLSGLHNIAHYMIIMGSQFAASLAILQSVLVGIIGTWLLLMISRPFRKGLKNN
jgi:hypothetical protein